MSKFSSNKKPTTRHYKLLHLREDQIKELKSNGYYVPLQDWDIAKVGFKTISEKWSFEKKMSFVRDILFSVGLQIGKASDGAAELSVDYHNKELIEALDILAGEETRVRVPEKQTSTTI